MKDLGVEGLIKKVQGGDRDAFGEIVERTARELRAFIAAFCPSAAMIDDLAQETYVRAWEKLGTYVHEGRFLAWLRGIARNVVLEELRRSRREAATDDVSLLTLVERESERQAADPRSETKVASLVECLESVPSDSRQLLREFYVVGRTSEEIARALRRTASWVRVTILRLRRKLAACVEAKLGAEGTVSP